MQLAPNRRLGNWIESFVEFTEEKKSPLIFKKWSAICAIAATMERKIWIRTKTDVVYPNLFVFLVGPPATGKTVAMKLSSKLLRGTEGLHVAPTSVSGASLNDALLDAVRRIVTFNSVPYLEFNSLIVMPSELSAFMPVYDQTLMANLTTFWDCEQFDERKRGGGLK